MDRLEDQHWPRYHRRMPIRLQSCLLLGPRAWYNGLNSVLYVPTELHGIRAMLAQGSVSEASTELRRLAELGSDPAAALLEYLCLRGLELSEIDRTDVLDRCESAASRGNGFAQYVLAWREFGQGNHSKALMWINRSVERRFLPAIADVGRFAADGVGMSQRWPDAAKLYLRHAIREGHLPSLVYLLNYSRRGAFGWWWRIPAAVVTPFAAVVTMLFAYLRPFEVSVFAHPWKNDRPPFVSKDRRSR